MISEKFKCIFIEVPKTGSNSIKGIIGRPIKPHLNICQIKYEMERNLFFCSGGVKNRVYSAVYPLLPRTVRARIGAHRFNTYFKFGFVRNPWDRVVSLYNRKEGLQLRKKMIFDDFVTWIKYSSSTCVHPVPHVNQLDWFVDPSGKVLVDFIGRFESIREDWSIISKRVGANSELSHLNKNTKRKHYSEYYNKKTKNIIADTFRTDIEYFNYTF